MRIRKGHTKEWLRNAHGKVLFRSKDIGEGFADFGDGLIVQDKDVYKFMKKHLRLRDRFNLRKIVMGTMYSFDILCGAIKEPKGKWYW